MRKTTYYCDRCGKELTELFPMLATHWIDPTFGGGDDEGVEIGADLCRECYHIVDMAIDEAMKADKAEYNTKPAKPTAAEKKATHSRKKIELDLGKLAALRRAGWTIAEIVDEMKVSINTIRRNMDAAEEFLKNKEQNLADDLEEALEEDLED